jgi:demethylmenaquinone methyltransferase/2-methoxy-6-polyprenyl-1,4-benzoquinol methylase
MHDPVSYDDEYVRDLFDRMGSTYDLVNHVSSFGFCRWWRIECVDRAEIRSGDVVCDLMAGGGECWDLILRRAQSVVSIDFSPVMIGRQRRHQTRFGDRVEVRCENAMGSSIPDQSVDVVVCAYGLKTLSPESLASLAREVARILKPEGRFSFIEVSSAAGWWAGPLYRFYLAKIIPVVGKLCLGDIECYRMLGRYTEAFGSCAGVVRHFQAAGLESEMRSHFFGCATSISGRKAGPGVRRR